MRRLIMLMLLALQGVAAYACDFCGCSSGSQSLGILPAFNKNFVGLQYQLNSFATDHPGEEEGDPAQHSEDVYHTLQLWGRYKAGQHLQLFAFVPWHSNIHQEDGERQTLSGIGDVTLLANAVLLKEQPDKALTQSLLAGGGIKMPTGAYHGISDLDRKGLPNMQAGTGSWDIIANVNYTVRSEKAGANLDASYTFTLPNADQYKYGNRLSGGLLGFYMLKRGGFNLLPQAGVRYEHTLHDYDNYSRKWLNEQSGGYMCFAAFGIQAYYKSLGAKLLYQLPVAQHYGAGYVTARQKLEAGAFFIF